MKILTIMEPSDKLWALIDFYQMNSFAEYFCPQIIFDFGVRGNLIFYLVEN